MPFRTFCCMGEYEVCALWNLIAQKDYRQLDRIFFKHCGNVLPWRLPAR